MLARQDTVRRQGSAGHCWRELPRPPPCVEWLPGTYPDTSPVVNWGTGMRHRADTLRGHALVEREDRGSSANLSAHVANGAHARAGDGLDAVAKVLHNVTSATRDGGDASNLQDDVLSRGPALPQHHGQTTDYREQLTVGCKSKLPPHQAVSRERTDISPVSLTPITLGHLSSHGTSAITSTASAPPTPMQRPPRPPGRIRGRRKRSSFNSWATGCKSQVARAGQRTAVGGVRVSANKQHARERVVFQDDLMDDARARLPEANAVLGTGRGEEVVDLPGSR